MCSSLNVAVIGAGVSGLMAGRELQIWGHKVTIFEKTTHIGGTWAYDSRTESDPLSLDLNREVVHSSSYSLLRTLHPRHVMRFSDYPFSKSCRDPRNFPGHEEVLKFFNEFWVEFGLCELTHMSQALGDSGYDECVVESRKGEVSQVEVFEAVVVCNGHNTEPRLAALKGMASKKLNKISFMNREHKAESAPLRRSDSHAHPVIIKPPSTSATLTKTFQQQPSSLHSG